MKFSFALIFAFALTGINGSGQSGMVNYHVTKQIKLSGDDGWDYLSIDSKAKKLFVSHGTKVQVVDLKKDIEMGTIPNTPGVHGIAIAADLGKGFISNGKDSSVTVFDLNTLATIEKISISGRGPDAILYDQFTHRIITFNGRSKNATVINAKTNKEEATILLNGSPEFAVTNGKGYLYMNIEDKNLVDRINITTMKVDASWSTGEGDEPSGLAFDVENQRLFSVCSNKMMIIMDAANGKIIQTLPIGENADAVVFDPQTKLAFSSNGEGSVTIVHEDDPNHFSVVQTVTTQKGAKTIALDTDSHKLYLSTAEFEPQQPSTDGQKHKRKAKPGTFVILVLEK